MSLQVVLFCSVMYIAFLFITAWVVDKRSAKGQSIVRNPYIYSLSLAVYCTAWTFYGSVGRASTGGLSFLTVYLGPTLGAPLWFLVLRKMVLISKNQRITSVADFISSRYGKSAPLASLVTLMAVCGIIPYISIQLKAIAFGIDVLTEGAYPYFKPGAPVWMDAALVVTLSMILFTALFGTRKLDPNERHEGMIAAIAFESLVKLFAFFCIGFFVTFQLYDGFDDLFRQAAERADINKLFSLSESGVSVMSWNMMMLLSALAILFLPRQFHVAVVENTSPRHITTAMWMLPLYLLLINIFVLPIAIAGRLNLGADINPDTYVLTLPLAVNYKILALLAFIGGFSAATSMIIVSTTALSIMVSNHLVVPVVFRVRQFLQGAQTDMPVWLLSMRRLSIVGILLLAYWFLKAVGPRYDLVSVGLISFAAVAQFAPSALGGMYWKRATHQGAMAGLLTGFVIWAFTLPLPTIAEAGYFSTDFIQNGLCGIEWLKPRALFGLQGADAVSHSTFWSLLLNTTVYALVSVNTRPTTLVLSQADLFVNIHRYTSGIDIDWVKREAKMSDLQQVLLRFLGQERTQKLLEDFERQYGKSGIIQGRTAGADLVNFAETHLAGAIGAASARLVLDSITNEDPITLDEMMQVLEQTREVLQYSRALEAKGRELEATTLQLRNANEKLKVLDRLKADFITTVTHELRTPVTSIKSLSKIMLDYRNELSEEKMNTYLQVLVQESERISRLINQVLDLEKIQDNDHIGQEFQTLNLSEILHTAATGMEQLYRENKVALQTVLPSGPVLVQGNRDQLIQVVVNLLSNALKFSPEESGQVRLTMNVDQQLATFLVSDNGIGIPPEKQTLIFEKFTQLSYRQTGKPQGSGLGLYITKTIVEQHRGVISVSSEAGRGATFVVSLPLWLEQ